MVGALPRLRQVTQVTPHGRKRLLVKPFRVTAAARLLPFFSIIFRFSCAKMTEVIPRNYLT